MPRSPSKSLSQDEVLDILSNARRRYVLYYLREKGEPVELGELAQELAAWENETTVEELTKQQRKRVYVSLYQTHIQKLADVGIVDYDQQTGMVSLVNNANRLGTYLPGDPDEQRRTRWQEMYIILAGVSAILYTLVVLDVSVFGAVSELWIGIGIIVAFATLAVSHYVLSSRNPTEIPTDALIRNR